jgi:hypothetical protein
MAVRGSGKEISQSYKLLKEQRNPFPDTLSVEPSYSDEDPEAKK